MHLKKSSGKWQFFLSRPQCVKTWHIQCKHRDRSQPTWVNPSLDIGEIITRPLLIETHEEFISLFIILYIYICMYTCIPLSITCIFFFQSSYSRDRLTHVILSQLVVRISPTPFVTWSVDKCFLWRFSYQRIYLHVPLCWPPWRC